jgi:hypothetical protein
MSPDDPRHGQTRGYWAHRRDGEEACDRCKRAAARYQATRQHYGTPRRVSALGSRRRVQALVALGWTIQQIAAEVGYANTANIWKLMREDRWIFQSTADKVALVYERLCMTRPEGVAAHRSRLRAARRGWVPPLAWDDIDDPRERGKGVAA